jgi:WD40 repeat protein
MGDIDDLAVSPDGMTLVSCDGWAGGDRTLQWWNLWSGNLLTFQPRVGAIVTVAFCPDGSVLAGAGGEGHAGPETVYMWDAATAELVGKLPFPGKLVWSLAFSPDGRMLAAGGEGSPDSDKDTGEPVSIWRRDLG